MAAIIATLPAMHLVCNIVVSETPGLNNNSAFAVTQPPVKTQPSSLPDGYVVYPDVNAAYKIVDESVSGYVAKERCARDNANLAVTDTALKIQLVKSQMRTSSWTYVGIYLMEGNSQWLSARTGLALSSIPWLTGEPSGSGLCAQINPSGTGLGRYPCSDSGNYVCELPIPENLRR